MCSYHRFVYIFLHLHLEKAQQKKGLDFMETILAMLSRRDLKSTNKGAEIIGTKNTKCNQKLRFLLRSLT